MAKFSRILLFILVGLMNVIIGDSPLINVQGRVPCRCAILKAFNFASVLTFLSQFFHTCLNEGLA